MTITRSQNNRSSVVGNRPAVGSRQPGEIYVNWPELQLGTINAAQAPLDLLAVRFFSSTSTYATGDMVRQAGQLYVANGAITAGAFNATQWTKVALATDVAGYLPLTGGTLTGGLTGTTATFSGVLTANGGVTTANAAITGGTINGVAHTGGTINGMTIGATTPAAVTASTLTTANAVITGGAINNTIIGATTPAAVTASAFSTGNAAITGGVINGTAIGATTPAAGNFTGMTCTSISATSAAAGMAAQFTQNSNVGGNGGCMGQIASTYGILGYNSGGTDYALFTNGPASIGGTLYVASGAYTMLSNQLLPSPDNNVYLGNSGSRWYQLWAGSGTIQTSDENEKQDIRELTEAERKVGLRLKALVRMYRWRDQVTKQETEGKARLHVGIIAQSVEKAFVAEGLDPDDYAMWRKDEIEGQGGKLRYSVDYAQVLAFIVAAI